MPRRHLIRGSTPQQCKVRSMTSCTQAHHLITPESPAIPSQQPSRRTLWSPCRAHQTHMRWDLNHMQGLTSQDPRGASAAAHQGSPRPAGWQTLAAQTPAQQPWVRPPLVERQATARMALGKQPQQRGCQQPCCPAPAEVRHAGLLPCICCWRRAAPQLPAAGHHRMFCSPSAFYRRDACTREAPPARLADVRQSVAAVLGRDCTHNLSDMANAGAASP